MIEAVIVDRLRIHDGVRGLVSGARHGRGLVGIAVFVLGVGLVFMGSGSLFLGNGFMWMGEEGAQDGSSYATEWIFALPLGVAGVVACMSGLWLVWQRLVRLWGQSEWTRSELVFYALLLPGMPSLILLGPGLRFARVLALWGGMVAAYLLFGPLWSEWIFVDSDMSIRNLGAIPFLFVGGLIMVMSVRWSLLDHVQMKKVCGPDPTHSDGAAET